MADPVDIEGLDEFILRLCRIEDKLNTLHNAVDLIFAAMAHSAKEGTLDLQDLQAIGEAMVKQWGWPGLNPLFAAFNLRRLGPTASESSDHQLVGFLATSRAGNNPAKVIKKLLKQ